MTKGFTPTRSHLHTAAVLLLAGVQHDTIAQAILNPATDRPISVQTLRAKLLPEARRLVAEMNGKVHMSLFQMATGENVQHGPKVAAQRFWIMRQDDLRRRAEDQARVIDAQADEIPADEITVTIPKDLSQLSDDELHSLARRKIALGQSGRE